MVPPLSEAVPIPLLSKSVPSKIRVLLLIDAPCEPLNSKVPPPVLIKSGLELPSTSVPAILSEVPEAMLAVTTFKL